MAQRTAARRFACSGSRIDPARMPRGVQVGERLLQERRCLGVAAPELALATVCGQALESERPDGAQESEARLHGPQGLVGNPDHEALVREVDEVIEAVATPEEWDRTPPPPGRGRNPPSNTASACNSARWSGDNRSWLHAKTPSNVRCRVGRSRGPGPGSGGNHAARRSRRMAGARSGARAAASSIPSGRSSRRLQTSRTTSSSGPGSQPGRAARARRRTTGGRRP